MKLVIIIFLIFIVTSCNIQLEKAASPNEENLPALYSLNKSVLSVSSSTVISGQSTEVLLSVKDHLGQAIKYSGLVVSFSHSEGDSSGSFSSIIDHRDGTYSAVFTGLKAGSPTKIMASIQGQTITSVFPYVSVSHGSATKLAFSQQPSEVEAGFEMSPSVIVKALDRNDNLVTNFSDSIQLTHTTGGGSFSGTTTKVGTGGVATFDDLSFGSVGSDHQLTASSGTLNPAISVVFEVTVPGTIIANDTQNIGDTYVKVNSLGEVTLDLTLSGPAIFPVTIGQTDSFESISLLKNATCATKADLSTQCWGKDAALFATKNYIKIKTFMMYDYDLTCGLTSAGKIECWTSVLRGFDDDYYGLFGNGGNPSVSPIAVTGAGYTDFTFSDARGYHMCALAGDTLKCWGTNGYGQLGIGQTFFASDLPRTVGTGFRKVSLGEHHTCGLKTDGTLQCWGNNFAGQIGDGTTIVRSSPYTIGTGYQDVELGMHTTCALKTDGTLQCWGHNDGGQVGDGTVNNRLTPYTVGTEFSSFKGSCGIKTNGTLQCWGPNGTGQVGDGTIIRRLSPYTIGTGYRDFASSAQGSDVLGATTCALKTDGTLQCWGLNTKGQVGDGTTNNRLTPFTVGTGFKYVSVSRTLALGGIRTCALTTSGKIKCWGENNYSQLGYGPTLTQLLPPGNLNQAACLVENVSGNLITDVNCYCNGVTCKMAYKMNSSNEGLVQIDYSISDGQDRYSDEGSISINFKHIYGCTDGSADNYDGNATADDGSCWWW